MSRNDFYNTKQKDIIFDIIKKQKQEFTIKDIYGQINGKVGLTTIYRLVDRLVMEGRVSKNIGKDNITYYQYLEECDEENHFYLKCECCGNMVHVDCDCIEEMYCHILKKHKFMLDKKNIIINGVCMNCVDRGVVI